MDVLNFEDGRLVLLIRTDEFNRSLSRTQDTLRDESRKRAYMKPVPPENDIGEARIAHLGNPGLLAEIERDVSNVGLHLI